jgi:excisionase family DNA binding protein
MSANKRSAKEPVPSRLLSAKDAARHLGIPYTTLRDLGFRGELPIVKFGDGKRARWFFKRSDLEALIERRTERLVG